MANKTFALEIGTEELPSLFVLQALDKIKSLTESSINDKGLEYNELHTFSTPRRIIVIVEGLPGEKGESRELIKGPPTDRAFDDEGNPTEAAVGFARKMNLNPEDLSKKEVDGREFVFAERIKEPIKTKDILKDCCLEIIKGLRFSKTLRWNDSGVSFPRPIRWILAMLDEEVVEFSYAGVVSGNLSYGHRIITENRKLKVSSTGDFLSLLNENGVLYSHSDRKRLVEDEIEKLLPKGTRPELVSELDRIVDTTEYPTVLLGSFDEKHLHLPMEVIESALMGYQDFFPVSGKDGLYPNFLAIHDGIPQTSERILLGYKRAIASRLEDASYFFEEDVRIGIDEYADRLSGIVFIEELGTMEKKAKRIGLIARGIEKLLSKKINSEDVETTARLCKADLASLMIQEKEFSSLEGVMGGYYALASGYSEEIAIAVREHYKPRRMDDEPPSSPLGRLIAAADKLDTLIGAFYLGLEPTGSEDPYALRRNAIGLIATIINTEDETLIGDYPWNVEVLALLRMVNEAYQEINEFNTTGLNDGIIDFLSRRLSVMMRDNGIRYDLANAAIGERLDDIVKTVRRAEGLQSILDIPDFDAVAGGFKRVINIVKQGRERGITWDSLDVEVFEESEEMELYRRYLDVRLVVENEIGEGDYAGAFRELADLRPDVDRFFDEVMVMCEDERLRENRLALMEEIGSFFLKLADFTKVVID